MNIPSGIMNMTTQSNFHDLYSTRKKCYITNEIVEELGLENVTNEEVKKEISYILFSILKYPSFQEANFHRQAQRLGLLDLKGKQSQNMDLTCCKCCGLAKQSDNIPLCTSFDEFPRIGVSTFLFFQMIKNVLLLLLLIGIVYSGFALTSNCIYSSSFTQSNISFNNFILGISLSSKKLSTSSTLQTYYLIEMWIGAFLTLVWGILLSLIKYLQIKSQLTIDEETISASDFSIVIENYPTALSQKELQHKFTEYQEKMKEKGSPMTIQKINLSKPLDLDSKALIEDQLAEINETYQKEINKFANWIESVRGREDLHIPKDKRKKAYKKYRLIVRQRQKIGRELLQIARKKFQKEQYNQYTMAVITFRYSEARDRFLKFNTKSTMQKLFSCCRNEDEFIIEDQNEKPIDLKIRGAPEPEDIKWQNLGISTCEKIVRKLVIYFITLLILSTSFGVVYFLSKAQLQNSWTTAISLIISFFLGGLNLLIGIIIYSLTYLEKDYSETDHQTSLAIKSIFAQLLNSIAVPTIVDYLLKGNIYGENGLAFNVFYISLINSFLPPLVKLINPKFYYGLLRSWWERNPSQMLRTRQQEFNFSQEFIEFEVGYEYISVLDIYLFTAFFVSLQPVIVFFALIGLMLFYWIQKYNVLNRIKRPVPGTSFINNAMFQLVSLGPIFYCLGALMWSHFIDSPSSVAYGIPNLVALGFSIAIFLLPFHTLFEICCMQAEIEQLDYEKSRIFLNTQYDRLNPITMEAAVKQYEEYLAKMKNNYQSNDTDKSSDFQKNQVAFQLIKKKEMLNKRIMDFNKKSYFGDLSDFSQELVIKSIFSVFQDKKSNHNTAPVQLIEQEEDSAESSQSNLATPCIVFVSHKKPENDKIIQDIIEEDSAQGLKGHRRSITANGPVNTYEHERYFGANVDLDKKRMTQQKDRRRSQNPYLKADF